MIQLRVWVMRLSHFWSDQWSTGVPFGCMSNWNHALFEAFFHNSPGSPLDVLASLFQASATPNTLVGYELPRTRPLDTFQMKGRNNKCCYKWSNLPYLTIIRFASPKPSICTSVRSKTTFSTSDTKSSKVNHLFCSTDLIKKHTVSNLFLLFCTQKV